MANLGYVLGFIGAGLMVTSYLMQSMLPLRLVALSANVCLVIYALLGGAWPTMILYLAMIPINIKKVLQIKKLIASMEHAKADSPVASWLLPHMKHRFAKAGETLWNKGDVATEMVYVEKGQLRLKEHDVVLGEGSLLGEIGLFSPDNRRTGTITCDTDCTLHTLSADGMAQLYYVNPKLGFHLMRLVVARLMNDVAAANAHAVQRDLASS